MFHALRWFHRAGSGRPVNTETGLPATDRKGHARRIAAARAALDAQRPALIAAIERATVTVDRARADLHAAEHAAATARHALHNATWPCDAIVAQATNALIDSATPAIAYTVQELDAVLARGTPLLYASEYNSRRGRAVLVCVNKMDADAERDRLRHLRDKIAALMLSVDDDLGQQLAALRADAGLPPMAGVSA